MNFAEIQPCAKTKYDSVGQCGKRTYMENKGVLTDTVTASNFSKNHLFIAFAENYIIP